MLALLHTSPAHVPVFGALGERHHPGLPLRHAVAEELLTRALAEGPDAVERELDDALRRAVGEGAAAVLCTCSTIGGAAEARSAAVGVPVLRVDRPMAAAAVAVPPAAGREATRVAVVATQPGTLPPTVALIEEEAGRQGRPVTVTTTVVDGAWELFQAGDQAGHLAAVAAAVGAVDGADVIVLAQASMAAAADHAVTALPVLSSPALGLAAAAALVAARA